MKHIYIDESVNEHVGIASLVAIEFDSNKVKHITQEFYQILKLILEQFPQEENGVMIMYPTPILHGQSFLQNSKENEHLDFSSFDDEFRFLILNKIIDLVVKYELRIIRVGYLNYNELKASGFPDDKMYGTNWIAISTHFNQVEDGEEYIFIMDGTHPEMISKFSGFISSAKSAFFINGIKDSLVIPNVDRFLNNVFYVPQKFCELLQIVDIIGYLLQKADYVSLIGTKSVFSERLVEISKRLNDKFLINNMIKMNF